MALVDYYNTNDDSNVEVTPTYWRGQSFTASQDYTIGSVKLKMYRSTGTSGDVVVYLYNADGDGKPTGSPLATGTLAISNLGYQSPAWHSIDFDTNVSLTNGTLYIIMAKSTDSSFWLRYDSGAGYPDGTEVISNNGGSTWYVVSASDVLFETYEAYSNVDLSGSISGTGSASGDITILSLIDIDGSISGSAGVSGDLSLANIVDIGASVSGSGALAAALDLYSNWQTVNFETAKHLVAIGNDEVWRESVAGTLVQVADSVGDINTSDMLSAFEAYQKVFIVNGPNKKVLDFINDKLTVSSAFTTPPQKGDTLTQATSGAKMVVDTVSADKKTVYGYRTTDAVFDTDNSITSDNAGGKTMDPSSFTPATGRNTRQKPRICLTSCTLAACTVAGAWCRGIRMTRTSGICRGRLIPLILITLLVMLSRRLRGRIPVQGRLETLSVP